MIPGTIPGTARDSFPWGMEGIGREGNGDPKSNPQTFSPQRAPSAIGLGR